MKIKKRLSKTTISKFRYRYLKGESTYSIAKKYEISHTTVLYHFRKIGMKLRSRKKATKLGVLLGRIKIKKHIIPKESKNLTKEKAYILGVLCGDGSIYVNKRNRCYHVILHTIDEDFAKEFKRCLESVYTIKSSFKLRKTKVKGWKNKFEVRLCSKEVCLALINYGSYFREKTWIVPRAMKNSPLKIQASFLRGLFDSDGTVDKSSNRISLISINLKGLNEVQNLLKNFQIRNRIIGKKVVKGRSKCFYLRIQDRKSVESFSNHINFTIERKRTKVKEIIQSYKLFTTPHEIVVTLQPKIRELNKNGMSYREIAKKLNICMTTVWRCLKR